MESLAEKENFRKGTLDEIVSKYEIVLFDTSALICPLYKDDLNPSMQIQTNNEQYLCRAAEFLQDYAEMGKISVIPEVFEEYSSFVNQRYHLKKKIKKGGSSITREVLDLMRTRAEKNKLRNNLKNALEYSGGVIQFNQEEEKIFESMKSRFGNFSRDYGISPTNFSFLMSGIVLSRKRDSTALVSNDFGIFNFFRRLRRFYGINNDEMNFFIRKDINQFEALHKRQV